MSETLRFRSIWISDVHLGTRDAKSHYLLDFLRRTDSDYLYLVGDIFDLWKLGAGWYWPAVNNELVQEVVAKARRGTRVVYVPGNHDERLRDYAGGYFSGVHLLTEAIHQTADGRRFLVIHGDEFDCVAQYSAWLAHLGSWAYDVLLRLNHWYNAARRHFGFGYWSLSAYLKHKVKNAVNFIGDFESLIAREAERRGVDGLICGHIHHAAIRPVGGCLYTNSGDWVESCTALVEDADGGLRVLHWSEESATLLDEREIDAYSDRDRRLAPAN